MTTDEELMTAYGKGDVDAFAELVRRHERPLWNFLRRFVSSSAAAEDLLQEVFLRAVENASRWQPAAKVSTWLYTIARNLCTDHARRAALRKAASLEGAAWGKAGAGGQSPDAGAGDASGARLGDGVAAPGAGGEQAALDREAATRIEAAVAALPVEQREVFLMREVMDMTFAEIAVAVGTSEPTVKSRMRYALHRLREGLQELRDSGTRVKVGSTDDAGGAP